MARKFLFALLLVVLSCSAVFAAQPKPKNTVDAGILTYLGTTEAEFQEGLDDLRKALAPLIPSDGPRDDREDYDMLEGYLSELVKNRRVVHFYDSLLSMQMALRSHRIDEIVLPEAVVMYLMANNPTGYEIQFSLNMMPSTISFGFKAGNTALKKEFDDAIKAMKKDGTLMTLENDYITNLGTNEPGHVAFHEFKGAPTIKVAVTGDLPPLDYVAADGRPAGYNTAILSEIGRRLKKNIRVIGVDAGGRSAALASERADVVFWYRNTEGMKLPKKAKGRNPKVNDTHTGVILSEPYYEWDTDLVVGRSK